MKVEEIVASQRWLQIVLSVAKPLAVAGAMAAAAKIRVWLPFTPVPVTLQTFVLLAAAGTMGAVATAGVALYVAAASAGLPVIAGPTVFGPTGGYLLGFVAAAALVGGQRRGRWPLLVAMLAASALIYLCGVAWLWAWSGRSLAWAIGAGVLPFLPGDAAKVAAAWAAVELARGGR